MNDDLHELSFTVSGRISRPIDSVFDAVADPEQLTRYFATGGARGRLEAGADVNWDFHDVPGRFPVEVVEAERPTRIVIRWDARAAASDDGRTTTTFEFEAIDGGERTLVTITETGWRVDAEGERAAFGNCEGWTGMLSALKVWLEHGVVLGEGFYA